MLKTNEYFEGKVKSIAFDSKDGSATIGVMEKGEYNFSTSSMEIMKVVSGALKVVLPGEETAAIFLEGSSFQVDANKTFNVTVEEETSYICFYK